MNRKVFTLLASVMLLFTTAFVTNVKAADEPLLPRVVAQEAVGDTVKTLVEGMQPGMYHIRLDSVNITLGKLRDIAIPKVFNDYVYHYFMDIKGILTASGDTVKAYWWDKYNASISTEKFPTKKDKDGNVIEDAYGYPVPDTEQPSTGTVNPLNEHFTVLDLNAVIKIPATWYPIGTDKAVGDKGEPYYGYSYGLYYENEYGVWYFGQRTSDHPYAMRYQPIILGVKENGEVTLTDAYKLWESFANTSIFDKSPYEPWKYKASIADLMAAMWCIDLTQPAGNGQEPTYEFNNKMYDKPLDWSKVGTTKVDNGPGWRYSNAYRDGQFNANRPFTRMREKGDAAAAEEGEYVTIAVNWATKEANKPLQTKYAKQDDFSYDEVDGMIYTTVVEVAPIVLTAEEFNTKLGAQKAGPVKLTFSDVLEKNPFDEYYLMAEPSKSGDVVWNKTTLPKHIGYLNIKAYKDAEGKESVGYIRNLHAGANKYDNTAGTEYLWLATQGTPNATDLDIAGSNTSYRFVYYPSRDSLVINAFAAYHENHNIYGTKLYYDSWNGGSYTVLQNKKATDVLSSSPNPYWNPNRYPAGGGHPDYFKWWEPAYDATGDTLWAYKFDDLQYTIGMPASHRVYWGLYNEEIHKALMLHKQSLSTASGVKNIATIANHPADVLINFAGCKEKPQLKEPFQAGVYTIWDEKGRCMGVRIYNGSLSPQWMDLAGDGEYTSCPDRIPAYQWVVEPVGATSRVNITNREFPNITLENVLLDELPTEIFQKFKYDTRFYYPDFTVGTGSSIIDWEAQYNPIYYGEVAGVVLPPVKADECAVVPVLGQSKKGNSGFRPVTNEYLGDRKLGYKWFDHEEIGRNAYAFNYLHNYDETKYINTKERYNDDMLHIDDRFGFQMEYSLAHRRSFHYDAKSKNVWSDEPMDTYVPETYGYGIDGITTGWATLNKITGGDVHVFAKHAITDRDGNIYNQVATPALQRWHYYLKVADFYSFQDALTQEYVVLKGAINKENGGDYRNQLKYGLGTVDKYWATKEIATWLDNNWEPGHGSSPYDDYPFINIYPIIYNDYAWAPKTVGTSPLKFADVYLREVYFIERETPAGTEVDERDPSRRPYYALLDRVNEDWGDDDIDKLMSIVRGFGPDNQVQIYNHESGAYEWVEITNLDTVMMYIGRKDVKALTDLGLEIAEATRVYYDPRTKYADVFEKISGPNGTYDSDVRLDLSSWFNLVSLAVDENTLYIEAQTKLVSSARVSTFALENMDYELYRRLRSIENDGATGKGTELDAPKTLRIYTSNNESEYLYEDGWDSLRNEKRPAEFLGLANAHQFPEVDYKDGTFKYNYHLFVDTAFINRGTGPIKPQYLIAVDVNVVDAKTSESYTTTGDMCSPGGMDTAYTTLKPYIEGRYLVNTTDSSRMAGSDGQDTYAIRYEDFLVPHTRWDRLAFVPAIHANDRLYIVSMLEKVGITRDKYVVDTEDGKEFLNIDALDAELAKVFKAKVDDKTGKVISGGTKFLIDKDAVDVYDGKTLVVDRKNLYMERTPGNPALGVFYDFGTWDNQHNDVCFSLRFVTPVAKNPNEEGIDAWADKDEANYNKRFLIESETGARGIMWSNLVTFNNIDTRKIAPNQGGWVALHNGMATVSRSTYQHAINLADMFNVELPTSWQGGVATSNESLSGVRVLGGTGSVTVLGGSGSEMVLTNVLGQVVSRVRLSSDREVVPAPAGVVLATVGGRTLKVMVK